MWRAEHLTQRQLIKRMQNLEDAAPLLVISGYLLLVNPPMEVRTVHQTTCLDHRFSLHTPGNPSPSSSLHSTPTVQTQPPPPPPHVRNAPSAPRPQRSERVAGARSSIRSQDQSGAAASLATGCRKASSVSSDVRLPDCLPRSWPPSSIPVLFCACVRASVRACAVFCIRPERERERAEVRRKSEWLGCW